MRKKAKIFSPDMIKTQICQAVTRDIQDFASAKNPTDGSTMMLHDRMVLELDKKYTSVSRDPDLRTFAIMKFLITNDHMAAFCEADLDLPAKLPSVPQTRYTTRRNVFLRARAIIGQVLSPFTEDEWFHCCKHGTGSSIGVSFSDTSIEAKSSFPITITSRASTIMDRYLDYNSQLKSALIYHNESTPFGDRYQYVTGSRATTVSKSSKIDRMIAVEPTGNMFLQQGLMALMYRRLKENGLDLETLPTKHRERARIASITSHEATIDWSSASDCVSIDLLRWLLPPMWFECCDMVRSPFIEVDGEWVKLNMFSTMGNAVTFPLETLVFWSLAHAVLLEKDGTLDCFPEWEDLGRCSVFGDDCIVPTSMAADFIEVLQSVGFMPNLEKSFFGDEQFRESCGGDYLRGYDVRPFSLKAPTSDRKSALGPWLNIIGNRIISKYISCFGTRNYMYAGQSFLCTLFDLYERNDLLIRVVPDHFPDDAGLKIAFDLERFVFYYRMRLAPIARSQHGLYSFTFHSFNYWEEEKKFEDLHYINWLRNPVITEAVSDTLRAIKRIESKPRRGTRKGSPNWLRVTASRQIHDEEFDPFRDTRKRGGYIVAKGRTVHWTVPHLSKVLALKKHNGFDLS